MLESPEPIDFTPLIKALQTANLADTFQKQLAEIELALVASEMNPKPDTFCDLLWAIEILGGIDITARRWKPAANQLEGFFS
jgi:hypothetical protein